MGRPTRLNDELIEQLAKEYRDGIPTRYVCHLTGVPESTLYEWTVRGEADYKNGEDTIYAKLWTSIKKAYAEYVKEAKAEMKRKEKGWQAIAWWLERTNPFFMPKQQIQADDDGKVTVVIGGKEKKVKQA